MPSLHTPRLRVLMVTAELAPVAKAGGLADMVAGLAAGLAAQGHDVRILMPHYQLPGMPTAAIAAGAGAFVSPVRFGDSHPAVTVGMARINGLPTYLVDAPGLVRAGSIYGGGDEEARRFALLAHAIRPVIAATGFRPDVVHCHDWHTALGPLLLAGPESGPGVAPGTVLTLHNVGYQGRFPASLLADLGLLACRSRLPPDDLAAGELSFLATGIVHADELTTVSPTHAREVLTPEYGHGLHRLLGSRARQLHGILNGVDYGTWDPAHDAHLPAQYSAMDPAGKLVCRQALVADCGLADDATPVLGCVSRLAVQKGLDLLLAALPDLLAGGRLRAVLLGSGDEALAAGFTALARQFPGRFAFADRHDETFAHRVYAGADALVVPSRYEPCGLTQLYALRYGTVPVVRATGGLADTVTHFDPGTGQGTGSVFRDADPGGVRWGIEQMLAWYADRALWARLVGNAMGTDFSWSRQIPAYEAVYSAAAAARRARA